MNRKVNSKQLEEVFPIWAIENDFVLTKSGDYAAVYEMVLPPIYTLSKEEYEAIHSLLIKAVNILPNYTVVHKQDIFTEESYVPRFDLSSDQSRVTRFFERHFNERPYLNHRCYLSIIKSHPAKMRQTSLFTTLSRGRLVPREVIDRQLMMDFTDRLGQLENMLAGSSFFRLQRLRYADLATTDEGAGLLQQYLFANFGQTAPVEDIDLSEGLKIGAKYFSCLVLDSVEQLPAAIATDVRLGALSTEVTDFNISFGSGLGLFLPCEHILNQYIFIGDPKEQIKKFEGKARNLNSLSFYSRENAINKVYYDQYLNEAAETGKKSIRVHVNVFVWDSDKDRLKLRRNDVSSAFSNMDIIPKVETTNPDVLWWAAIPGNGGDFPHESTFHTFTEQAVCFLNLETNQKNSTSPFGIRMVDRMSGVPIYVDLSDEPMKRGIITNRNKFIVGPSGSGKSFFTNHMLRQYYEQGSHVLIVDVGKSYEMLAHSIHVNTKGTDGLFLAYEPENPISFNPFYTEDGTFDIEKMESIKTLISALWKKEHEAISRSEEVALSLAINAYINYIGIRKKKADSTGQIKPCFNTFYEFVRDVFPKIMEDQNITRNEFHIQQFLFNLSPYYRGGEYDFLLNNMMEVDLVGKRFIVFELDNIKDHPILFPVVTLIIMETFISKMRRLKGIRKVILIEEAWKAIAKEGMAEYIKYLFKTVRKFQGEALIVTQEINDIIHSPIVKDSIINNSDCKILLDQRKYMKKFDDIAALLGLSEKEKSHILSINQALAPDRRYKEVWFGLGGQTSAVYATEVSPQEYPLYTTEEREKMKFVALLKKNGGDTTKSMIDYADGNV